MKVAVGLLAVFAATSAVAQVPDHVNDTMRRIFASGEFAPQRFGPARWIENGAAGGQLYSVGSWRAALALEFIRSDLADLLSVDRPR